MKTNKQRSLDSIEAALIDLKMGKMIIVVDDENRENEGDFIMNADLVTPQMINFMATVGRGLICTPLTSDLAQRFDLPLQVTSNTASLGTAFTVTIDAKDHISTGISAADRSHTIHLLTKASTLATDFVRPGHIFPLIAKDGGVLERPGHTEAAVDLAKLSGSAPVGVICEIMNPDGSMARLDDLFILADEHDLKIISIEDLISYRKKTENLITQVESVPLPTKFGNFTMSIFRSSYSPEETITISKGDLLSSKPVLTRVHSECLTGDVFGSCRCDCGAQLEAAMKKIETEGSGLIIYLRQEGRGIGLFNKIKAYQLQDKGLDTAEANLHLGFPIDSRDYTMAGQILRFFKIEKVKLMTNNPDKILALEKLGFFIEHDALEIEATVNNTNYLMTKKEKMGHLLYQNLLNH